MVQIDFDFLKITLMVAIVKLRGNINIYSVYPLLHITRTKLSDKIMNKAKIKIPHLGFGNAILSARFNKTCRGIQKTGWFANAITLDVATTTKNISVKLSSDSLHVCGANSDVMVLEAIEIILNNIKNVEENLQYLTNQPEKMNDTIMWVLNFCQGPDIYVYNDTNYLADLTLMEPMSNLNINDPNDVVILKSIADQNNNIPSNIVGFVFNPKTNEKLLVYKTPSLVIPEQFYNKDYPECVDTKIADWIINMIPDFARWDLYELHLNWLSTQTSVIEGQLEIKSMSKSMVNYNYDLGFTLDKWLLAQYFDTHKPMGFKARYDNCKDIYVTINLKEVIPVELQKTVIRKNKKSAKHSFLIYESGLVTQSGPCEEMIKRSYIKFYEIIHSIRDIIELKEYRDVPRKLTYTPFKYIDKIRAGVENARLLKKKIEANIIDEEELKLYEKELGKCEDDGDGKNGDNVGDKEDEDKEDKEDEKDNEFFINLDIVDYDIRSKKLKSNDKSIKKKSKMFTTFLPVN